MTEEKNMVDTLGYIGFLVGGGSMVSYQIYRVLSQSISIKFNIFFIYFSLMQITFHCFIVSILLYKARQTNVSNILKIIFNFMNFLRFVFVYLSYETPDNITKLGCQFIQYILLAGSLVFRCTLVIFLLWRLFQIKGKSGIDKWPSIILLIIKLGFSV